MFEDTGELFQLSHTHKKKNKEQMLDKTWMKKQTHNAQWTELMIDKGLMFKKLQKQRYCTPKESWDYLSQLISKKRLLSQEQ